MGGIEFVICFKAKISFFQFSSFICWQDIGWMELVGGIEFGGVGSPSVSVERHELVP